jgi:hypothetical protein
MMETFLGLGDSPAVEHSIVDTDIVGTQEAQNPIRWLLRAVYFLHQY